MVRRALYAGWLLLAVLGVGFVFDRERFEHSGHAVSAVAMFVGIIIVVMVNVRSARQRPNAPRYVATYQAIAWSMGLTLVAVVVLHLVLSGFQHIVILVEALLIVEFAAFWVVQTVELWDYVDRSELIASETAPQT